MKRFMALLKESERQGAPPPRLLDEAGRLCQNLQHSPASLEKLVTAMAQGRHWGCLCSHLRVVQACVLVYLRKNQYDRACRLLESCSATEKEELVKLWHEIHYRKAMEKRQTQSLTPVQKYRCRKRCPPPASLCPDGVKNRNYPQEVREALRRFAVEVTTNPSRKQREGLACDTNLPPHHIYNWFANYRRRHRPRTPSQAEEPLAPLAAEGLACQGKPQEERMWRGASPQPSSPGKSRPFQGGLPGDAGMDQREWPLITCSLSWEQAAGREQGSSASGAFLLQSSIVQSDQLGGLQCLDPRPAKEPPPGAAFAAEPGSATLRAKEEPAGTAEGLWLQRPVQQSWGLHPAQQQLVEQQHQEARAAPGAVHKGVQCSLWSCDASCQCWPKESLTMWQGHAGAPCHRMYPGVHGEASPGTVREQADLEIEGLVLRERQLLGASWEAQTLPYSSAPSEFGKPPYVPVTSALCPEENQVLAHEQMPWASVADPSALDTLWAASLLCEFSLSGRMALP